MKTAISLLLLLWSGQALYAADYHIKIVTVKPIEEYPARTTVNGITIAADPYSTDEESYTAFDVKHLNSRGYFPLHVIIKNDSSSYLKINTRNVLLFTPDGEQLYSTPATIVVDDVTRSGLTQKDPARVEEQETLSKKGSPLTDFTSKELIGASIEPGSVVDGFLFFFSPEPAGNRKRSSRENIRNLFTGSSLYIPKVEEEGTKKPFGPFTIRLDAALQAKARAEATKEDKK